MSTNELANNSAQIAVINPEVLLTKAVESGASVEAMERILAMRKELKEEHAKDAYYTALSAFQAECPSIKKTREVKGRNGAVMYRYANLDDIIRQVKPILNKHGLSYIFKTLVAVDKSSVDIVCISQHIFGHSAESSVSIPIDPDSFMNDAQKSGSAQTYAKRYAFCNAFGIMTGDEDDDGKALGNGPTPQDLYKKFSRHMKAVLDNIDTILTVKSSLADDDYEVAAEAMAEIDYQPTLSALFLAPTKGGCFTIEEKEKMGSDEYKQFYAKHREGKVMEGM